MLKHYFAKAQPWFVCLSASLFFFYEFVQMSMFNAINPSLIHDFSVSATALGNLSAAYFYANILFMFPAGLLIDRVSTKLIIVCAMIVCIIGTVCFSLTSSLNVAIVCRFLTGIGGSFPFLCCLRLASRWFPPTKLAFITGLMVTMAMLGGATAQTPLTLMVEHFGWRHAVLFDGLLGVLFVFIILGLVQNQPKYYVELTSHIQHNESIWHSIKKVVKNRQNWLFGIYTCMLNLPVFLLAQLWGSLYLIQVKGFDQTHASYITSMVFFGTIVGSPFIGFISDRLENRRMPMLFGAVISLGIIFGVISLPEVSLNMMLAAFFLLGFFTSSQILSYPAISESNDLAHNGGALGLASVLIMMGGAVFEPLFGWLMELHWDHTIIDNTPIYAPSDYHLALMILPVAFAVGIIVTLLAKETNCQRVHTLSDQ